ncbi:MAG: helix-turn-helix transcriptional regulator [Oscillospiraceae bacterium]|nr:helix-turn-helix transcriptional regulator [Oscillospiraceae bacterium]
MSKKKNEEEDEKKNPENKLSELRKKNGNIQKDVAEALQMPLSTYGEYERGERGIPLEKLIKLAELFDVSINEIFYKPLPERYIEVSADEKEIILKYRSLKQYDKGNVRVLVNRLSGSGTIQKTQGLKAASRDTEDSSENDSDILSKHIQDFENAEDFSDDE